ncbi:MAG: tetratricopeptide repeat protein [Acaryochloridaceae cyanobacterium SU_2_1]|nr:tetratricopeptide repeat protein [Acaryochloridaceae cyanobacterium SU_2_1]NJM95305.1 tetratricopeptide repeat protein [Acaryochloridaceae cyanobacterium CSU_5_19]
MAEGCQPHEERLFDRPSLRTKTGDEVTALIKRGLTLANEVEARLHAQINRPTPAPPDPLVNQPQHQPENTGLGRATQLQTDLPLPTIPLQGEEAQQNPWAMVWLQRGLQKFGQGDYQGAGDNFKQALQKQPSLAIAHNALAGALYHQEKFLEAVVIYHQALDHDPDNAQIYCNLGSTLYQLQDFDEATIAFQQALQLDLYLAQAYYGLGLAYYRSGFYEESIIAYEQAIHLNDHHAESFVGLGIALYYLGDYQEASLSFRQAMQLDPRYIQLHMMFQDFLYPSPSG